MGRLGNQLKTALLLGLIMGLAVAIGRIVFGEMGIFIGLAFGGFTNIIAYFLSDKIALASMRAQPVTEQEAPGLVRMVRELASNAGLPMPRVYVSPQPAPNAFATGRNPNNAVVCVTEGLLRTMPEREVRGVLGHELAHIANRDILITTIAATFAGAITSLAYLAFFFGGGRNERNPFVTLLLVLLAPIAAALIQLWISRTREYGADAYGSRIAGDPLGLASALRRLQSANERIPMQTSPSHESMFIVAPLSAKSAARWFSTHPPTEERIRRLEAMAESGLRA
jgi:heat shock protein HtpX